jgi:hypothetical protein
MGTSEANVGGWKAKISHELIEYGINAIYLALVFASFTEYRRLLLAAHDIVYTNYWVAVIEGLVLGKVIMIGSVLRLGRWLEDKPLIVPTLYKTVVFTVFVAVFKVIEHGVRGLWHGLGFMGGLAEISEQGVEIVLANALVVIVAFIPFFAVKELGRVWGEQRMWALFFRTRTEP